MRSLVTPWLLAVCALASTVGANDDAKSPRIVFTGDILLARQVEREIEYTGRSPWQKIEQYFVGADWVVGNLEGAVGEPEDCIANKAPCFSVPARLLGLAADAGFSALSIENNHAADLGIAGRERSVNVLRTLDIAPLRYETSPGFLRLGEYVFAFVPINTIGDAQNQREDIPSYRLAQKLRLARTLANFVVVYVHWGNELQDWSSQTQHRQAEWLVAQGVDLIVGHHPHVIQPVACVGGKPVFFSLGNHVFDQKYPHTKEGLIADCRVESRRLVCGAAKSATPAFSTLPNAVTPDSIISTMLAGCVVAAHPLLQFGNLTLQPYGTERQYTFGDIALEAIQEASFRWKTIERSLLSLEPVKLNTDNAPLLFTLEKHFSRIDDETAPRPYVYEVTSRGLVAKWRGSALAWPLLDAVFIHDAFDKPVLCALHRDDSFLKPSPTTTGTRTAVYRWNGFGFSIADDRDANDACRKRYASAMK